MYATSEGQANLDANQAGQPYGGSMQCKLPSGGVVNNGDCSGGSGINPMKVNKLCVVVGWPEG